MKWDLGDLEAEFTLRIKGQPEDPRRVLMYGPHEKTVPADRVPSVPQPYSPHTGKVDIIMQLKADKKRALLGLNDLDEMGNVIGPSPDQPSYTTDDVNGDVIVLTDNGDGTGVVAAVGVIGSAQVTATYPDGSTWVESVNVTVGDMATRAFNFGEEEEVTPD